MESSGYDRIIDYRMSEKFGTSWKEMESNRAYDFISIMRFDGERQERESKKHG